MVRMKNVQLMSNDKVNQQKLPSKQQSAPAPAKPAMQEGSKSPIINPAGRRLPPQAVARGIARRSPPKVAPGIAKKRSVIKPKK